MKKVLFLIILMAHFSCERPTEKTNVPEPVQASFDKKYPGVKVTEWQVQHDKYVAKFTRGNEEIEAEFIGDGTFLREEKED